MYGNQSIVLAIDIKKDFFNNYRLYSNSGKNKQKISIEEHIKKCVDYGCGEIYLNSIDMDGTMKGYDLDLISKYSKIVNTPLVASGGAGEINHFSEAIKFGASAVSAGAMFVFQGIHRAVLISYPEYRDLEKELN